MTEHHQAEVSPAAEAAGDSPRIRDILVGALTGAVGGVVVGLIFVGPWLVVLTSQYGLPRIVPEDSLAAGILYAAIGALIGSGIALAMRRKRLRREATFRWITQTLGGQFSTEGDAALDKEMALWFSQHGAWSYKTRNIVRVQIDGIRFVAFDLRFYVETGTESSRRTKNVQQTVAYYASDSLRLPAFGLGPRRPFAGLSARLSGRKPVDLSKHVDFSQRYEVTVKRDENEDVARLFGTEIIGLLAATRGLCISSDGSSMVLFCDNVVFEDEKLKDFVVLAGRSFRLFEQASRRFHPGMLDSQSDR